MKNLKFALACVGMLILTTPTVGAQTTTPATPTSTESTPVTTTPDGGNQTPTTSEPDIDNGPVGPTAEPVVQEPISFFPTEFGEILNLGDADLPVIIARLVGVVLSFLGLVFFVMILYSGFLWLLSGGNDERVAAARRTFVNALIGLVIIFLSYAFVRFVFDALTEATGSGTTIGL